MPISRTFRLLLKVAAAFVLIQPSVNAAEYPARPITLIVPWSPGGGSDLIGRLVAKELESVLKQTIVVDNKPGAAGIIGTGIVAKAQPDGYTLLLVDSPHVINGSVVKNLPFDPVKDFAPVATIGKTPLALVVHPSVPAKDLREFRQLALKDSKLNLGSGGIGALTHMTGELLKDELGVKITHVPFKGTGQAIQNIVAGQVQATMSTLPGILPHVQSGKLRAIVVTSEQRAEMLPDVPTTIEAGTPNLVEYNWYGLVGPAGLPESAVQKINGAVAAILERPEFRQRLAQLSISPYMTTPAQMKDLMIRDQDKWTALAKKHNIVAE